MTGTKRFRPWHSDQQYLLPPAPRDWLPEEHLVFFVLDVVESRLPKARSEWSLIYTGHNLLKLHRASFAAH